MTFIYELKQKKAFGQAVSAIEVPPMQLLNIRLDPNPGLWGYVVDKLPF
jgi:hypothetical protein